MTDDIPDAALEGDPPYIRPAEGSDAMEYLRARGRVLDGPLPVRVVRPTPALRPDAKVFEEFAAGSGKQAVSTTMVFARLLRNLVRDPTVGSLVAPIVSDEARTFGLEPLIAEAKIYAPDGQHYIPVDADLPLNYAESSSGQMLQEGITEAGALSTFIALSTAYATWGQPMVPVYLFYSMFGFQRVGDLAWALGDMRGRGILAGCTAGRTTLMGEGLQHDDGQSPLLASTNPAALVYDASFAYEVAVIMEAAVTEMLGADPQDRFWYLTLYNESYPMPPLPEGAEGEAVRRGIIEGIYRFAAAPETDCEGLERLRASLCFSGPMWTVAADAQRILAERYGVAADTWAVTSWTNLRTDALEVERWNRLHPEAEPRTANITRRWAKGPTPFSPSPTTCVACPTRWRASSTAPTCRSGPTASDAPTPATRCAPTSRSTRPTSSSPSCSSSRCGGKIKPSVVAEAIAEFGIDASRRAALRRLNRPTGLVGSGRRGGVRDGQAPSSATNAARPPRRRRAPPGRACAGPPAARARRRRRGSTPSRAGPGPPPRQVGLRVPRRGARRCRRPPPRTDHATRARHSSARSPIAAASRLQAIGTLGVVGGRIVIGAAPPPGRRA